MISKEEEDTWKNAIKAVEEEGLSYRQAAEKYGVSKMSLHRRVKKKISISAKSGPASYLSFEEEKGLLDMITFKARHGMCMNLHELRSLARKVALAGDNRQNLPENFPSVKWVQRFIKRNPTISSRKSQILDCKRAENSTVENVEFYFSNLSKEIENYPPERIYNCDETGITAQGSVSTRVVCPKGMKANVRRSNCKENVSIMACCSADGRVLPPMYIFMGKRRQLEWMDGCIPGFTCAMSESSMINGGIFCIGCGGSKHK